MRGRKDPGSQMYDESPGRPALFRRIPTSLIRNVFPRFRVLCIPGEAHFVHSASWAQCII